jgi:cobalamin biosynthesis protein CobT
MSEQYEEQNTESSGQDQTEGGGGGEGGGGEENNEADMIFAPEASKPGRNAGMLMVAFVLIGVGVIYFMRARGGGPAPVSAEVMNAEKSIKDFIRDGNQIKNMKNMLNSTEKVVQQFNVDRTSTETDKKLEYNPFTYHSPNEKPNEDPNDKTERDRKRKMEARKLAFANDIQNIKVQYIMVSSFAKTAMINNKLVQEGQEVDGFTIEKLSPNTVIVQRDGLRAEIKTSKEIK